MKGVWNFIYRECLYIVWGSKWDSQEFSADFILLSKGMLLMAMVSILWGPREYLSWQNQKHKKEIIYREEGGEFCIKYMELELKADYWKDSFIRHIRACIRNKDKSNAWLPSDQWNYDYGCAKIL